MKGWACSFVFIFSFFAPASGIEQVQQPPIYEARDIDISKAGPLAGGFTPVDAGTTGPGLEISATKIPGFARLVNHREIYDGAAVGGPHLLIEGVRLQRSLDIYTPLPIVIRGAEIGVAGGPWAVHMRPGSGPLYVSWSRIGGADQPVQTAILLRGAPARIFRSHISVAGDAIHADAAHALISDNLIDGLSAIDGWHNDAIQIAPTASDVVIHRNRILNQNPQTSCIYIGGNTVTVSDNYLAGGGWVIYGGAHDNGHEGPRAHNVSVTGNIFGFDHFPKSGNFGPVAYWDPANTWSNNHFATGAAVEYPKK